MQFPLLNCNISNRKNVLNTFGAYFLFVMWLSTQNLSLGLFFNIGVNCLFLITTFYTKYKKTVNELCPFRRLSLFYIKLLFLIKSLRF